MVVEPADGHRATASRGRGQSRDYHLAHVRRRTRARDAVGALHHARGAGRHVPGAVQQRLSDRAGAGLRGDRLRDDPRSAHHSRSTAGRTSGRHHAVERRPARPLGRQHAGHRNAQLQRQGHDRHERRHRAATWRSAQRRSCTRRAVHASRAKTHRIRGDDQRSEGVRRAVEGRVAAESRRRLLRCTSTRATRATTRCRTRSQQAACAIAKPPRRPPSRVSVGIIARAGCARRARAGRAAPGASLGRCGIRHFAASGARRRDHAGLVHESARALSAHGDERGRRERGLGAARRQRHESAAAELDRGFAARRRSRHRFGRLGPQRCEEAPDPRDRDGRRPRRAAARRAPATPRDTIVASADKITATANAGTDPIDITGPWRNDFKWQVTVDDLEPKPTPFTRRRPAPLRGDASRGTTIRCVASLRDCREFSAHRTTWTSSTPAVITSMVYLEHNTPRRIWMDGRTPPADTPATPMGFSVGRWEGDALVIETTHLSPGWLDGSGLPMSGDGHTHRRAL